jgi:hypothetical protein
MFSIVLVLFAFPAYAAIPWKTSCDGNGSEVRSLTPTQRCACADIPPSSGTSANDTVPLEVGGHTFTGCLDPDITTEGAATTQGYFRGLGLSGSTSENNGGLILTDQDGSGVDDLPLTGFAGAGGVNQQQRQCIYDVSGQSRVWFDITTGSGVGQDGWVQVCLSGD